MDAEMVDVGDDDEQSSAPEPGRDEAEAAAEDESTSPEAAVEADIAALIAERDQYKDIALRLQADFENYRKRQLAAQADEVDRATGRVVEALLPALDACELAYAHGVQGVEGIWSNLIGALQKQGLEALDSLGKPFDPSEHEAVLHEPGDHDSPTVTEVLRTGYRWKGKVLRAAMVKVAG